MPLENVSRAALGRAAYNAATDRAPSNESDWPTLLPEYQESWNRVADAVLAEAGLHMLVEDALDESSAVSAGIVEVGGSKFMRDARGNLMAVSQIKAQHVLEDEVVRKIMRFAIDLSAQISRFKGHCFADLNAFESLLEQRYSASQRTSKGNVTYSTYDDTMKVEVRIADQIAFGPELRVAKKLVDECLVEWGADSHEALRSLVNRVFSVEKEGQINRGDLFSLLAMEVSDKRWQSAMDAIRDSIRVIGTKAYLRFRIRDAQGALSTVTIDLAAA